MGPIKFDQSEFEKKTSFKSRADPCLNFRAQSKSTFCSILIWPSWVQFKFKSDDIGQYCTLLCWNATETVKMSIAWRKIVENYPRISYKQYIRHPIKSEILWMSRKSFGFLFFKLKWCWKLRITKFHWYHYHNFQILSNFLKQCLLNAYINDSSTSCQFFFWVITLCNE